MLYRCYLHLCTYLQRYAAYLVDTRVPGTRHRDSRRGREKGGGNRPGPTRDSDLPILTHLFLLFFPDFFPLFLLL